MNLTYCIKEWAKDPCFPNIYFVVLNFHFYGTLVCLLFGVYFIKLGLNYGIAGLMQNYLFNWSITLNELDQMKSQVKKFEKQLNRLKQVNSGENVF